MGYSALWCLLVERGSPVANDKQQSWYSRVFGRSLLSVIFGNFFENKNNAASIIAIMLVASACYVVVVQESSEYTPYLLNALFVVIGYYFGIHQNAYKPEVDE